MIAFGQVKPQRVRITAGGHNLDVIPIAGALTQFVGLPRWAS